MKYTRTIKLALFSIMFCLCNLAIGQTYSEEETNAEEVMEQEVSPDVFRNLGISNAPNPRNLQISGNSVSLRQIGEFNRIAVNTNTRASEISLSQNGNDNFTALQYDVNTAVANLQQNGNANTIYDYVINPEANISLDLIQEGDGLNFERFGTNSRTESLQLKQTNASPSIIIRSFQ